MKKWYFVWYNGAFIAQYRSVKACQNFIDRKGLQNDYRNLLEIVDNEGELYHLVSGRKM